MSVDIRDGAAIGPRVRSIASQWSAAVLATALLCLTAGSPAAATPSSPSGRERVPAQGAGRGAGVIPPSLLRIRAEPRLSQEAPTTPVWEFNKLVLKSERRCFNQSRSSPRTGAASPLNSPQGRRWRDVVGEDNATSPSASGSVVESVCIDNVPVWLPVAGEEGAAELPLAPSRLSNQHLQDTMLRVAAHSLLSISTHEEGGAGDFAAINRILSQVTIRLPDQQFTETDSTIDARNIVCGDLSVKDVELLPREVNKTTFTVSVAISGVAVQCTADIHYMLKGLLKFISADFAVRAQSTSSNVGWDVDFTSNDFARRTPNASSPRSCSGMTAVKLSDLEITGNIIGTVENVGLAPMRAYLETYLQSKLTQAVCTQVDSVVDKLLQDWLAALSNKVEPYLRPRRPMDPLAEDGAVLQAAHQQRVRLFDFKSHAFSVSLLGSAAAAINPQSGAALVRALTGGTGVMTANPRFVLVDEHTSNLSVHLEIDSLTLSGLDNFTDLSLLSPISFATLLHQVRLSDLGVNLSFLLDVSSLDLHPSIENVPRIVEHFSVMANLKGVAMELGTLVAMERVFLNTTLGSFVGGTGEVNVLSFVACACKSLFAAVISDLNITVDYMSAPRVGGFDSWGVERLLDQLARVAFRIVGQAGFVALPAFTQMDIRHAVNAAIRAYIADPGHKVCPHFEYDAAGGRKIARFDSPQGPLEQLQGALGQVFTPLSNINDNVIGKAAQSQSGVAGELRFYHDMPLLNTTVDFRPSKLVPVSSPSIGFLHILMENVTITGLDSLDDIHILKPTGLHSLYSSLRLGAFENRRAGLHVDLLVQTYGGDLQTRNHVQFNLSLSEAFFLIDLWARVDQNLVLSLTLGQITDLACWVSTVDAAALRNLTALFGSFALGVTCAEGADSCTSDKLRALAERSRLKATVDEVTTLVNEAFARFAARLTTNHAATEMQKYIETQDALCHGREPPATAALSGLYAARIEKAELRTRFFSVALLVVVLVLLSAEFPLDTHLVAWGRRWVQRCRKNDETTVAAGLSQTASQADAAGSTAGLSRRSLMHSLPGGCRLRYPFLVGIAANIALFAFSHWHRGACVDLHVAMLDSIVRFECARHFSIIETLIDLWKSGSWFLAILLCIFSVIWPYMKLLWLTTCMVVPPSWLSTHSRGRTLTVLDKLGKWSLMDVYVIVICILAFNLDASSPADNALLGHDFYRLAVKVRPVSGLFAFCCGVVMSIGLGQFCIEVHRKDVDAVEHALLAAPTEWTTRGETEALPLPVATASPVAPDGSCGSTARKKATLAALIAIAIMLQFVGGFCPAFTFKLRGLAGSIQEAGVDGSSRRTFSFVGIAGILWEQMVSSITDFVAVGLILLSYIVCAGVLPLIQLACLLLLSCGQLKRGAQEWWHRTSGTLSTIASMEVFIAASVVGILELPSVSAGFLGSQDDMKSMFSSLHPILHMMSPLGLVDEPTLLVIDTGIEYGMLVMLAGAMMATVLSRIVHKTVTSELAAVDCDDWVGHGTEKGVFRADRTTPLLKAQSG